MSTASRQDFEVAVIGAGVVGSAVGLALARRGVAVVVLEAESEPGLGASGTNSGILHTGFDSVPGELETELILASNALRDTVLDRLQIPVLRCGAVIAARDRSERRSIEAVAARARHNGCIVCEHADGGLEIPDESVSDPVRYTLALTEAARRHGAELWMNARVQGIERDGERQALQTAAGDTLRCRLVVNCAGLHADAVARLAGDHSFEIYPRKGEFLVFEPPDGRPLARIMLAVPTERTKGVLVFPTVDGKVVAGPTAVDQDDKRDWSVRPGAREEIVAKATAIYPPLADAEPIAYYAGLRPAGRGVNYLIGPSPACKRLVNVAAIRSTGLSASLGIGVHVAKIVRSLGVALGPERELQPGSQPAISGPWWRRTAELRAPTR